jgi:hypothetical protein
MTEHDPQKVEAVLQDYEETLEVLTINSKPLINDLTMAAGRYKPLAPKIIEKIESRLFEVSAVFSSVLESLLYAYSLCLIWLLYIVCWFGKLAMNGDEIKCGVSFTAQFSHPRPSVGTLYQLCYHESKKDENLKQGVVK